MNPSPLEIELAAAAGQCGNLVTSLRYSHSSAIKMNDCVAASFAELAIRDVLTSAGQLQLRIEALALAAKGAV